MNLDSTSRSQARLAGMTEKERTQILVSCGSQGSATVFDAVLDLLNSPLIKGGRGDLANKLGISDPHIPIVPICAKIEMEMMEF